MITPAYHIRRVLDKVLSTLFPPSPSIPFMSLSSPLVFPTRHVKGWSSLYNMVTFRPDVSYEEALRKEKWQKGVVGRLSWVGVVGVVGLVGLGVGKVVKVWQGRT